MQFSCPSVRPSIYPWTQFCPELPLLNHSPFCDQNLPYDNALLGGMITYSDSSLFLSLSLSLSKVEEKINKLINTCTASFFISPEKNKQGKNLRSHRLKGF